MSCLNLIVTLETPCTLAVSVVQEAVVEVAPESLPEISVAPVRQEILTVTPTGQARLAMAPAGLLSMTIGEVCSVSHGTIVVLAAADGPLRTRNGGYFLLNPDTNPPEN